MFAAIGDPFVGPLMPCSGDSLYLANGNWYDDNGICWNKDLGGPPTNADWCDQSKNKIVGDNCIPMTQDEVDKIKQVPPAMPKNNSTLYLELGLLAVFVMMALYTR